MSNFAEACYDQNSITELQQALSGDADQSDMVEWGLTVDEWFEQIKEALDELVADQ